MLAFRSFPNLLPLHLAELQVLLPYERQPLPCQSGRHSPPVNSMPTASVTIPPSWIDAINMVDKPSEYAGAILRAPSITPKEHIEVNVDA